MREILFRGKSYHTGDWVYGGVVHQTDFYGDKCDKYFIIDGTSTLDYDIGDIDQVIPETVGQHTGLTDKNGKDIFEGDIVKCHYETYGGQWDRCFEVVYFNGIFELKTFDDQHFISLLNSTHITIEVIGNIQDNPELLES